MSWNHRLLSVVVALALSACGSGDDEADDGAPDVRSVTPTPDATQPPATEPAASEPAPTDPSSTGERLVLTKPMWGTPMTVTIAAAGWQGLPHSGLVERVGGGDPPDGAALIGPFYGELYVYGDPCKWSSTVPDSPATTVDEVVAALTAQASRDASAATDITADGYAGKSITLHVPEDAAHTGGHEGFSDCDEGKFASWAGGGEPPSDGPSRFHQGPGQIDELWIVDVDGELVVIDAMYGTETPAEHVAELHAILESITFDK